MKHEQHVAANRKTLAVLSRITSLPEPPQEEPFPRMQRSRKVCSTYELTPENLLGDTWNPQHLDKLLKATSSNNSFASKSKRTRKLEPYLMEGEGKNACKYGYTNVFPLIGQQRTRTIELTANTMSVREPKLVVDLTAASQELLVPKQRLEKMRELRNEIDQYHKAHDSALQSKRLKQILECSFRHGASGYENPESPERVFSEKPAVEPTLHIQRRRRANLDYEHYKKSTIFGGGDAKSYQLSADMKHKRHNLAPSVSTIERPRRESVRMFDRPQRAYNILNLAQQS